MSGNDTLPPNLFCDAILSDEAERTGNGILAVLFLGLLVLFTYQIIAKSIKLRCERSKGFISYMIFLICCWLDCFSLTLNFLFKVISSDSLAAADLKLFWLSRTIFIFIGVTFVWHWLTKVNYGYSFNDEAKRSGKLEVQYTAGPSVVERVIGRILYIAYSIFGFAFLSANIIWMVPLDEVYREKLLNNIFAAALILSMVFRILTTIALTRVSTQQKKSEIYSYTAISSFLALRDIFIFIIYIFAGLFDSSSNHELLFSKKIYIGILLYILNFWFPLLMFYAGVRYPPKPPKEENNDIAMKVLNSEGKAETKPPVDSRAISVFSPEREARKTLPTGTERFMRYLKLRWKAIVFYSAFSFILFFVFMWGLDDTCRKPERAIGASVLLSRGSARVIMAMSVGVFMTVLPYWLTKVSQINLGLFLPLEENIDFHKFFAVIIFIFGWLHTFGHINNVIYFGKYGFDHWGLTSFNQLLTPLITGILLLIATSSLIYTGFFRKNFKKHEWFIIPHRFMAGLFIVSILPHGASQILSFPYAWAFLLIPLLLTFSDNAIRIRNRYKHTSNTYNWEIIKDRKSTFIKLTFKDMFSYQPGQYAWLWSSQVSWIQWHPFSISSGSDNEVQFMIEVRGEYGWTDTLKKVLNTCQKLGREYPKISIDGPFSSPAYRALYSDRVVLVAGNIGITPMLSILKYRINHQQLCKYSMKILWTSNSLAQIEDTMNEIQELLNEQCENTKTTFEESTHFHCTDTDPKLEIKNPLIKKGRPDIHDIFLSHAKKVGNGSIHVFICGGKALGDAVENSATIINTLQTEVKFYVHKESF